ncbi:MAG: TlpA family protein disulfide reductase [Proteobacteria bacterium]|nr:TlpA family protein disulfide reductase [Pseudomonadota bacterium]
MIGPTTKSGWLTLSTVVMATLTASTAYVVIGDGTPRARSGNTLAIQRLDGGRETLADFRGRAVLLTVWATWCWSCRQEMPALARLHRQSQGRPLVIIALSVDREGAEVVKPLIEELGVADLAVYLDPEGGAVRHFSISGLPTTILLGPDGLERRRWYGARAWDEAAATQEIASLLADKPDKVAP